MDRTARRFDAETISRTTKTHPRGKARGKSRKEAEAAYRGRFEAFTDDLRRELAPDGLLQSIYAERIIVAAWRLHEAVEAERAGVLGGLGVDPGDLFDRLADDLRRQTERAERSLARALDSFEKLRDAARPGWGRPAALDTTVRPVEDEAVSDQFPTFGDTPRDEESEDDAPLPRWQDRLIFDEGVSESSPVVKGTWVTVAQIVSLIVDGQTWADILRSHPELTEEDIRICLAYATEQENDSPWGAYLA